jgi:small-conductance mechanosensitive channel
MIIMNVTAKKVRSFRSRFVHLLRKDVLKKAVIIVVVLVVVHVMATSFAKILKKILIPKNVSNSDGNKQRPIAYSILPSIVYSTIMITVIAIIPLWFGFETASIVAIVAALAIAVGIGLQGTLGDLAAGLMLLLSNTYRIGDYIEVPEINMIGRVSEFGVLYTYILDENTGIRVSIPNRSLYSHVIYNHSSPTEHVVVIEVTVSNNNLHLTDHLEKLKKSVQEFPGVINKRGLQVTCNVSDVGALGTKIEVRFAMKPEDFVVKGTNNKRTEIATHIRETLVKMGVSLVELETKSSLFN